MKFEKLENKYFAQVNEYTYEITKYDDGEIILTKTIPNKPEYKIFDANYCWNTITVMLGRDIKTVKEAKLIALDNFKNKCEKQEVQNV